MDLMKTTSLRTAVIGLCLAVGLAGCGSDKDANELGRASLGAVKSFSAKLKPKKAGAAPKASAGQADPNVIISKALSATKGPVALVVRMKTNAVLAMSPVGSNGGYVTWGSAAGQGITYKRGIMTSTRGLGDDLMSSRVDTAISAITSRRNATYKREHYYLGDLGQSTRLVLDCSLNATKSERVAIGAINANATIMKEHCANGAIAFDNLYWVDGGGRVLKSSQWVGQRIGNLVIQNLRL